MVLCYRVSLWLRRYTSCCECDMGFWWEYDKGGMQSYRPNGGLGSLPQRGPGIQPLVRESAPEEAESF